MQTLTILLVLGLCTWLLYVAAADAIRGVRTSDRWWLYRVPWQGTAWCVSVNYEDGIFTLLVEWPGRYVSLGYDANRTMPYAPYMRDVFSNYENLEENLILEPRYAREDENLPF